VGREQILFRDIDAGERRRDHEERKGALAIAVRRGGRLDRGEDDVEVGETGIGDEHLVPFDQEAVTVRACRRGHRREIGAGFGLGGGKGRDRVAPGNRGQVATAGFLVGRKHQTMAAESLHGKEGVV
jgi:hypothetical protein